MFFCGIDFYIKNIVHQMKYLNKMIHRKSLIFLGKFDDVFSLILVIAFETANWNCFIGLFNCFRTFYQLFLRNVIICFSWLSTIMLGCLCLHKSIAHANCTWNNIASCAFGFFYCLCWHFHMCFSPQRMRAHATMLVCFDHCFKHNEKVKLLIIALSLIPFRNQHGWQTKADGTIPECFPWRYQFRPYKYASLVCVANFFSLILSVKVLLYIQIIKTSKNTLQKIWKSWTCIQMNRKKYCVLQVSNSEC